MRNLTLFHLYRGFRIKFCCVKSFSDFTSTNQRGETSFSPGKKTVSSNHKPRFRRIVLQYRLKRTTEKKCLILSGNTASTSGGSRLWAKKGSSSILLAPRVPPLDPSLSTSIEKGPVSSSRSWVATECCESSFMKSSSFPAAGQFSWAVFHGGQCNITINTVNKSPTSTDHSTQSTRSFKRVKRVFESSDEDSPTQWQTKLYWLANFVNFKRAAPYSIKKCLLSFPPVMSFDWWYFHMSILMKA